MCWSCLIIDWSYLAICWSCLIISWSCLTMWWSCLTIGWPCLIMCWSGLIICWSCLTLGWSWSLSPERQIFTTSGNVSIKYQVRLKGFEQKRCQHRNQFPQMNELANAISCILSSSKYDAIFWYFVNKFNITYQTFRLAFLWQSHFIYDKVLSTIKMLIADILLALNSLIKQICSNKKNTKNLDI